MNRIKFVVLTWCALIGGIVQAQEEDLYDMDHITDIQLTFVESNWESILNQLYAAGDERLMATKCVINGVELDSVGVRFKGNATYSSSSSKNPLNIALDEYKNQDYQGFETLKLSNGKHDPSFVREVLTYQILRNYMAAPLCNYAKVTVNGSYYGLFSSAEAINSDFGKRYLFAGKDNTRIKCNAPSEQGPPGQGSGSSLAYLGSDSSAYYSAYEVKSDYGWKDLATLINTVNNDTENAEATVDLDQAIWMLAVNNVLVNMDSYSGRKANYYIIKDNNDVFNFIMWDFNESFGGFPAQMGPPGGGGGGNDAQMDPYIQYGDNNYPLIQWVFGKDTYWKMYIAHCKTILEEFIANGWYYTRAQELNSMIKTAIETDPNAHYTYSTATTNLTQTVADQGWGMGGTQGGVGITELMEARKTYLQSHADYTATQPTVGQASASTDPVMGNSTVTITASIQNAEQVLLGYRFEDHEEFTKVQMYDDGNHNDGSAGDGVFGADVTMGITDMQYFIFAENELAGIFSPQRAAFEYHIMEVSNATTADLVINEFMASNDATVADQDGEFDDWVELHNNTDAPIDLTGYHLSDNAGKLKKFVFPSTTIEAKGYVVVWLDGDVEQEGLHADFKLSANGEALYLSDPDTVILDEVIYGVQSSDQSLSRYPNGTGDFAAIEPTFGAENGVVSTGLNEQINTAMSRVYPNPVQDVLMVKNTDPGTVQLHIFDAVGKRVYAGTTEQGVNVISTSALQAGLYTVHVGDQVFKILKN